MEAKPVAAEDLSSQLQLLYDQVPSTCCASSGECCALTDAEFDQGWATMFPLYSAEYLHIAEYVRTNFPSQRQQELFSFTQERPRRCPFLGENHACTIYAVRPLICRTYAVMDRQRIDQALVRYRDVLPETWLKGFARREGSMLCPRVRVTQPEKLEQHIYNLITGFYERALRRIHDRLDLAGPERRALLFRLTGRREWPLNWTWGGFNALCAAPADWVRAQFPEYWKKAKLVEEV
ncbi:MAG: YkgJ family cysteine cluster protein [Candidatus Latescibacteria bacterium]|nr:YkgJ family cysteine cluster protein [Candidatus Latescibacterota bacterium]